MQIIPTSSIPAQSFSALLNGQEADFAVYQKNEGLFIDLSVNGVVFFTAKRCLDGASLVDELQNGFIGDILFCDMAGNDDPVYTGLGDRFQLVYKEDWNE